MNISRFFGSTNREALRQVRLALGPDALIVSNKRVNGGVEILATDPTSAPEAAAQAAVQQPSPQPTSTAYPSRPPVHDTRPDVMNAIGEMRGALENRIDELLWGNQLRRAPQAVSLFQTLLGFGFSTALLRAMLKRLPEQLSAKAAFQWARHELVTHLPVLDNEDALWKQGLALALVGPTGVGKTTTLAKLAARCVRRTGPDGLVLLTTDTYRIGAHEQLNLYGQMLRVPVHVVQDVNELREIMQRIRPDQTILIDNVGVSQRDRYIAEQAAMLAGAGRPVQRLLVLNASSHGDTLDEVARSYANDGGSPLKGCIITKVDEASRLGAALDTAIRYQLPIHYISNGQKVPKDLAFLQAAELVDQALVHSPEARALYAPTEADFAALMSLSKAPEDTTGAVAAEQRRTRLLPGLLSLAGDAAPGLSMDDLQGACAYIDDQVAVSEACDVWRAFTAGTQGAPLDSDVRHMARVAQSALTEQGETHALALHDQAGIRLANGRQGQLRATLLLGGQGRAYTTVMQQLNLADGWQSSCGTAAQVAPSAADALHHQVQWMAQQPATLPVVHLIEGGSQGLWRRIHTLDVNWLVQCAATTRLYVDACATTAGAVAKTLHHQPVTDGAPLLGEVAGVATPDTVLWVATQDVQLMARQQPELTVRLVSLRVLSRLDGSTLKTMVGISNMLDADAEQLGAWLLIRTEARAGLRYAARAWDALLPAHDGAAAPLRQALTAVQMGLAAWQFRQDQDAQLARRVAAGLIGKREVSALTATPALLKLFRLKEMLA